MVGGIWSSVDGTAWAMKRLSRFGIIERGLTPAGQVYEAFARRFVERNSGDFALVDGNARRLFAGERAEFLSRADSILSRTHYLEQRVKMIAVGVMIVSGMVLTMVLNLVGLGGNRVLPVTMIAMALLAGAVMQVPYLLQRREMKALQARLERRVASRDVLPDELVATAKDRNPWIIGAQIAAMAAVVIAIAAMVIEAETPGSGGWSMVLSSNEIDDDKRWVPLIRAILPFIGLAWLFFFLGRVREWRNAGRLERQRGVAALAGGYTPSDAALATDALLLDDPLWDDLAREPDRR
jgi:hypothetical protein